MPRKKNKSKKVQQGQSKNGQGKGTDELQANVNQLMAGLNIQANNDNESPSSSSSTTQEVNVNICFPPILPKGEPQTEEDPKWEALNNDLIWNKIMESLTHNDMKKLSLVCSNFQFRVKNNKRFQDSSKVILSCRVLTQPIFAQEPKLIWKHVDVSFDIPMAMLVTKNLIHPGLIRKRLLKAQSLQISSVLGISIMDQEANLLKILLAATVPSLKSLTLDCVFLALDLKDFFENTLVRFCLQELDELHISAGLDALNTKMVGTVREQKKTGTGNFRSNMESLLDIPMKLKKFSWGRIDAAPKMSLVNTYFAVPIVQENRLTLTSLSLELYVWCIEDLGEIICPSLKDLKIFARAKNYKTVNKFLKNQPDLESLDLEFHDYCFHSVIQAVVEKSSKLKIFRMKTNDFEDENRFLKCLSGMSQLEEFGIHIQEYSNYADEDFSTASVLKALPTSVTRLSISRLHSGGMDTICDHVCFDCPEFEICTCENACQCFPVSMAQRNIHRLSNFTHLTQLTIINRSHVPDYGEDMSMSDLDVDSESSDGGFDLENDQSMINDEVLQFIIANLSQLKILRFAHCPNLTDFGITGITSSGVKTGLPLSHLTGLGELVIKDCPQLTDPALVGVVKFHGLVFLYAAVRKKYEEDTHQNMVSESALIKIVKQNPRLKTVVVHSANENLVKALKKAQPSLVCVNNVHKQTCNAINIPHVQEQYLDPYSDREYDDKEHYITDEEEGSD